MTEQNKIADIMFKNTRPIEYMKLAAAVAVVLLAPEVLPTVIWACIVYSIFVRRD